MVSLRNTITDIALATPFSWRASLHAPRPSSVRELMVACRSPRLPEWTSPERSVIENEDWTEEINGIVTDGSAWYASSNADDDREGLYKLTTGFGVIKKLSHPFDVDAVHIGALCLRNNTLFVPMQYGKWGVWMVDTGLVSGKFFEADSPVDPEDDIFPWCDVHPRTGLLYTSNFSDPKRLLAYGFAANRLVRRPDMDIPLVQPTDGRPTTRVQGGCFTPHYKWLAVCDVDDAERIHCHSTLSGALLGRRSLRATADEASAVIRNELEGIWYHPYHTGQGHLVHVHVLELNNEHHTADDMYLWHFAVPDPIAL